MFNSRLTTMEYRAVARSMDRHRRHFSIRPFNAYLSGSLCRTFRCILSLRLHYFWRRIAIP